MRVSIIAFPTVALLGWWAPALAGECTLEHDIDKMVEAFKQASCAAAYQMFEDCAFGASGDVPLGEAVQEKCEAGFLSKLDAPKKSAYGKQLAACDRKYAKQSGTMYRSAEAFCRAGAARDYAKRYAK